MEQTNEKSFAVKVKDFVASVVRRMHGANTEELNEIMSQAENMRIKAMENGKSYEWHLLYQLGQQVELILKERAKLYVSKHVELRKDELVTKAENQDEIFMT